MTTVKKPSLRMAVLLLGLTSMVATAPASSITLTNSDPNSSTATSFNSKGNWNDTVAPNPANDYTVTNFAIRTPDNNTAYTFQGNSLTLSGPTAVLALKGNSDAASPTIGTNAATGLTLANEAAIGLWDGNAQSVNGFITLGEVGGKLDPQANNPLNIRASIGGPGYLKLDALTASGVSGGRAVLLASNYYTGGTIINANMRLQLAGVGTLGSPTASFQILNTNNNRGYGVLDLNGTSQTVGSLSGTGGRILNDAVATVSTLTIGNGDTGGGHFAGTITNGAGVLKLVKAGSATITLSGTNGYTGGTTIEGGTLQVARIGGPLGGGGRLVLMLAPTNVVQQVSGTNAFSGEIVVMAGWLAGVTDTSLGTNSITVDPFYSYDPSFDGAPVFGPAVLEPKYNLNSAGTLTLVNGGMMALHQNCAFTAVTIEGIPLGAGTHYYSELAANFPASFLPGGSGAITVQPYGTLPGIGPIITANPTDVARYTGRAAVLAVAASGTGTLSYQWRQDGVNLGDTGNVSGATSSNLQITNLTVGNAGAYDVVVTDVNGAVTSLVAQVTVVTPEDVLGTSVLAENPEAFYRFNDNGDSFSGAPVYDYAGGHHGNYGTLVVNGTYGTSGPVPSSGYPGFAEPNGAALFTHGAGYTDSRVPVSSWNLNTNTVTIAAWIKPDGAQNGFNGLVMCRGTNASGLNYTGSTNADGNFTLGYTWNNEGGTWNWNSGITAPPGDWSLVALVVTPTNAAIHVINTNGALVSSRAYSHVVQSFNGTINLGNDSFDPGARGFNGTIDDVAVFGRALTQSQLIGLFAAASGVSNFPPVIVTQPASQTLYEQQTAQFNAVASGTAPLVYRWESGTGGVFADIVNGGRVSGATDASLVISNLAQSDELDYRCIITNAYGAVTSSVVTLTVEPVGPAETITNSVVLTSGQDWNTASAWSDGLAASTSSVSKPGSSYYIVPGGGLRTPNIGSVAAFPGNTLTLSGDGVYNQTLPAGTIGALMLKGTASSYKQLVLAGGEILSFTDSNGGHTIAGDEVNVIANTPIGGQTTSGGRSITLSAKLTGNGTVEYRGFNNVSFQPSFVTALNVAGTNNTFTGQWNVLGGTLVGSTPGALGTNTITVASNAALQASYDIYNPEASLVLDGRLNLTRNHTFRSVIVAGVPLTAGAYSFATLNASYPANFPSSWTGQTGALTETTATGSLTVLGAGTASYPTNLVSSFSSGTLSLSWPGSHLGWILQQQTNTLGVGLNTNWVDVVGSEALTSTNIAVNPFSPAVFYRLRHP